MTDVNRICVVGCPGAGKSTFARRCAALGYAHLELDGVFHQANWEKLPDDEGRARIDAFTRAHDRWVVDGNYTRFRDLLWPRADTIVWIDPGRWTVSRGVIGRSIRRLVFREVLWNGNREQWSAVFSLDPERSILLWAWTRFPHYRKEYARAMHDPRWSHLTWVRLPSRREADAVLSRLSREEVLGDAGVRERLRAGPGSPRTPDRASSGCSAWDRRSAGGRRRAGEGSRDRSG